MNVRTLKIRPYKDEIALKMAINQPRESVVTVKRVLTGASLTQRLSSGAATAIKKVTTSVLQQTKKMEYSGIFPCFEGNNVVSYYL